MKWGSLLAVFSLVSAAAAELPQALCPIHCRCSFSGTQGGLAKCSVLDVERQMFPKDIQRLKVENAEPVSLSSRIFVNLGLQNLTVISIHNTTVSELDSSAFNGLDHLQTVELVDTGLLLVHSDTFRKLPMLKRLSLAGNPLQLTQFLPSTAHYFLASNSLQELVLSRCQLVQLIPQTFAKLYNLALLDLSENSLTSLSGKVFDGLGQLEELNLSNNDLSEIPEEVFDPLEQLMNLKIRGNPIKNLKVPLQLQLNELDASDCQINTLDSDSLENLSGSLSSLNLSSNAITYINPLLMDSFSSLKYLDLSYNSLMGPLNSSLFAGNDHLEILILRGNPLGTVGKLDGDFQWFSRFDLSDCGLRELKHETFHGMRYLTILNVSGNSIPHIDSQALSNLRHLTVLDLSANQLSSLPPNVFASNSQLSKLYLGRNLLKHITAASLRPLTILRYLDVSDNRLHGLWNSSDADALEASGSLASLTELDLSTNEITHFSIPSFKPLQKLRVLHIDDNPIDCRPPFVKVIQWLSRKKVVPSAERLPFDVVGSSGGVRGPIIEGDETIANHQMWGAVFDSLCPHAPQHAPHRKGHLRLPTVVGEPPLLSGVVSGGKWPTITFLICAMILVCAINITLFLYARARRQRPNSFGGLPHRFPSGRRPAYQKLYEECSVPNPIVKNNKKLSVISAFTHSSNGPVQAV